MSGSRVRVRITALSRSAVEVDVARLSKLIAGLVVVKTWQLAVKAALEILRNNLPLRQLRFIDKQEMEGETNVFKYLGIFPPR